MSFKFTLNGFISLIYFECKNEILDLRKNNIDQIDKNFIFNIKIHNLCDN